MTVRVFVVNRAYSTIDPEKLRVLVGSENAPTFHRLQLASPIQSVDDLKDLICRRFLRGDDAILTRPDDIVDAAAFAYANIRIAHDWPALYMDDPRSPRLAPDRAVGTAI